MKNNTKGIIHNLDKGLEVHIIDILAQQLGLNVIYIESSRFGEIFRNGTATHNLKKLHDGHVDIVIGGYAKTYIRSIYFDTSK